MERLSNLSRVTQLESVLLSQQSKVQDHYAQVLLNLG